MTLTCEIRFFGLKNAEKTEAGGRGGGEEIGDVKRKKKAPERGSPTIKRSKITPVNFDSSPCRGRVATTIRQRPIGIEMSSSP